MSDLTDAIFLTWLKENGHQAPRPLNGGRWAAILPLLYTAAIVCGRMHDCVGYEDRWCYHDYASAKAALDAWSGEGEPEGWHRHPTSGRRRAPNGVEYVAQ